MLLGGAALALAVVACAVVVVWWPTNTTFKLDSGLLIGSYVEGDPPMTLAEIHRELALHMGGNVQANRLRASGALPPITLAVRVPRRVSCYS